MRTVVPQEKNTTKNKKPKIWAVADCETDSFDGFSVDAFVWAFITSTGERSVFWDTAEFVAWLREFDGIVYAHNGGRFDWLMPDIVGELAEGRIMLINGRVARAKIGKAEIRDSYLCLPAALEKFGEKDDFDYRILDRKIAGTRKKNRAKIEKYIMQDCVALFNAMAVYVEKYGHALTQAGAALKTWEAMGGEKRRYGKAHDTIFRPYYFGGRCEVFEYGAPIEDDLEMYDITSSYPRAMMEEHCCGTDYIKTRNYEKAHPSSFWTICGVSHGALPFRNEKGAVYFPNDGEARLYHCTGWEVKTALEFGKLEIIEAEGLVPTRFESFAPYITKYFAEREEAKAAGNQILDAISKIFMNSLYGKFGANPEEYKDYKVVAKGVRDWENGWFVSQILEEVDILERATVAPQYFDVAVAASITGYARAALMRAIFSSKGVVYCDTDSLLCRKFGGEVGEKLGQWKFEGKFIRAWIAGKKCYALEGDEEFKAKARKKIEQLEKLTEKELRAIGYKVAHKGVSKIDATIEDIKRAAAGEVVEINKSAPNCKLDGSQVFFSRKIRKT